MKEKRDHLKAIACILVIIIGILSIYTIFMPKSYIPSIVATVLIVIAIGLVIFNSHKNRVTFNQDKVTLLVFLILWFFADIFRLPHMGYGILTFKAICGIAVIILAIYLIVKDIKNKKEKN